VIEPCGWADEPGHPVDDDAALHLHQSDRTGGGGGGIGGLEVDCGAYDGAGRARRVAAAKAGQLRVEAWKSGQCGSRPISNG
jgi:hypothetical protein